MFKKILNFLLLSSITSAVSMLLFACSVGLGESVDTEVPKIEITYPPASSAVRDWFYLAGNCSDDKGVDSIVVSAKNISTNENFTLGTAIPAKDGTWQIKINEKDSGGNYKLKDGTYTFSVIATDSSKQQSAPNIRTLELDNTAPVFVIKNPGTTKSDSPAPFGSILKIVGAAADEHEIYELELKVYSSADMSGEPKATLIEKNVDKTDGINVTLARYNPDVALGVATADELHNNYLSIYNAEGGGDQQLFASVTLRDSAGVWQNPLHTSADSIGNSTSGGLYLNDDIYDELMGKKSKYGLTAADFMKIINGTYKNVTAETSENENSENNRAVETDSKKITEENIQEVLAILNKAKTDTSSTPLSFKLNKDANPTYEVMGFAFNDSEAETFASHKAAKKSSLTFKAQAGLDGTYIKPSTLKVYMFGPYSSCSLEQLNEIRTEPESYYNSAVEKAKEQLKAAGNANPSEELVEATANARILADYSENSSSSTETFTETIELPSTITKGSFYVLAASGKDIDGLSLLTQNNYGFVGESAGTPPTIVIDGFTDGAMANVLGNVKVSGTLKSEETELAGVTYSVVVFDEINAKNIATITGEANFNFKDSKLSADWNIADFSKGNKNYVNGYSSFEPNDGERFKYSVTVSGKDRTGLESKDTKSFTVDMKKPDIKINDITPVAKKESAADGTVSKYIVNGKIKFSTVVTDTNLKNVKVSVTDGTKSETLFEGNSSTIEKEIDTTKYKDENLLKFTVEAEDSAENTAVSSKADVWVSQKTDKPEIKFTNGQNVFGIENNNSANFTITDDDGLSLVRVTVFDENKKQIGSEGAVSVADAQLQAQPDSENAKESAANPVEYKVSGGSTSYALAYKLPQKAGKYKILIEVFDTGHDAADETNKGWHTTKCENYVLISEGRISISFAEISNNTCQVKAKEKTTIKGTVSLSALEKLASIERFASKETTVTEENEVSVTKWIKVPDCSSKYPYEESTVETERITAKAEGGKIVWEDNIPASMIVDGTQHFFYKATDIAGNSAEIELICNGDGNVPDIKNDSEVYKKYEGWVNFTSVKLSVIAADVNGYEPSGIAKVSYSYNKGESAITGELSRDGKSCDADGKINENGGKYYKYSATPDLSETPEAGTMITFTAEDKVGNKSDIGPFAYKVDTTAPSAGTPSIVPSQVLNSSGSVVVTYSASDALSGVKSVEFSTDSNMKDAKPVAEKAGTYAYPLAGLQDGERTVYVRVTDNAGNRSESVSSGSFIVDNTPPKVTVTSPASGSVVNKTISLSGTVVDNNLTKTTTPVLQYLDGDVWKPLEFASSTLDGQNWTISGIDTTKLNNSTGLKEVEFKVQFTDDAGNVNESLSSEYKLKVDQKTDRPEIKLTNVKKTGSAISSNIVQGVISDDDGVAGKLKLYRIDKADYSPASLPDPSGSKWKAVDVESGTGIWKAVLGEDEKQGEKCWYFYVIDENGEKFCTAEASQLKRPYLSDSVISKEDNTTGISFFYDTNPPEIEVSAGYDGKTFVETNIVFGGADAAGKNKIHVRAIVTEEVGMASKDPATLFVGGKKQEQPSGYPKCSNSKDENGIAVYTYDFAPINISDSSYKDGSLAISVTAEDSAGLSNKNMMNVMIDKTPPMVTIVSPTTSISDAVTSAVSIKGLVQDSASYVERLMYTIPKNGVADDSQDWKDVGTSTSWEIKFASGAADSTDSLIYYVKAKNGASYTYSIESFGTEGIFKLPVWFKVKDTTGNEDTIKDQYVLVDSEGGSPKAWINSPENGATTSGVVTIYGGAIDNISVAEVRVQIDANNDGKFDADDYTEIKNNWNSNDDVMARLNGSGENWYILANGTNSWKLNVDSGCITEKDKAKSLRIRVKAFDNDGNSRDWTEPVTVKIDDETPVIKNLKLVQYGKGVTPSASSVPVTEREYISGMYISNVSVDPKENPKGKWYLKGEISDNQSVASVTFNIINSSGQNNIRLEDESERKPNVVNYDLLVPLRTDESGVISYEIKAKDNNVGETSVSLVINIDSTPPSLYNTSGSETLTPEDALRLQSMGEILGTGANNTTVVNNNKFFTFGDVVSEAGSGLEYIAFYFERTGSDSGKRIYNPMFKDGNITSVSSKAENPKDGDVYKNEDGLVAMYVTDAERKSEDSITIPSANKNIRKGGLIKIAGSYSLITEVTGTTVKFSPSASIAFKNAEIILAQVVDHKITESLGNNGVILNDDGDEMIESISQLGIGYTWSASVDSTNIPDGPINIHIVAIDNAGNISKGSIATKVENNRPRIAKVMLATDLNGNGKFDYDAKAAPVTGLDSETVNNRTADGAEFGEFSFYSAMEAKSTNLKSEVELKSGSFKVIGGLAILPEFVGGNGDIFYMTKYSDSTGNLEYEDISTGTTSTGLTQLASKSELTGSDTKFANKDTNPFGVTYADLISEKGGIILNSVPKEYISFTFWDSTEETTPGTDSQWTHLKIPVTVLSSETEKPVPTITPFYWENSTENSVYIDGGIKGHIELENDLTQAIKDKFNDDSVIKPKVSGKIKIEGTVTDNVRISSINMGFDGLFSSKALANYVGGTWQTVSSLPNGVVTFTVHDVSISQKGHEAKYTLVVDTEELTSVAGKDKNITISATDWNGNSSVAGTAQTTENAKTAMYRVDVVPYITQIWTGLSETKPNNPSMYARASTGEYVVRGKTSGATYKDSSTEGETITVYGWNLNNSPQLELGSKTISGISIGENTNENVKRGTYGISFVVPDENSDKLTLTVNGIQNLNNINKDDARGSAVENTDSYEGYYNRQPNGDNNNKLTDDVELHIWNFKNAVTPSGAAAKYVHMKVGPYLSSDSARSGRIGFSFRNGAGFFNMPGYMCDKTGRFEVYIKSSTYNRAHMYSSAGNLTGKWPGKNMTSTSYEGTSGYYVVDVTGNYSGEVTVMFNQQKDENNKSNKYILSSGPGRYVIDSVGSGENVTNRIIVKTSYASSTFPTLYSQTKIGQNYQGFSYNTFTFDKNGETYGAALCSDTSGTDEMSANFQFFSRGCGESTDSLDFNYNNCLNGRRIENTKNPAGTYDEDRVKSPAMATFVNNGKTYVYMAYWDHLENRVIYRVGSVDGTGPDRANSIDLGLQDLCKATGFLGDGDSNKIGSNKEANARRNSTDSTYVGDKGNAYKYVSVLEDFSGVTDAHVSVASLSDGSAVISWYDDRSRSLKAVKITLEEMLSAALNGKSYSPVTISSNGGAYVSVVSDSDDGLHFAYSSNSGANLYYAYANSSLSGIKEMLVDVNDDVGDNCTIDVARESSSSPWIPTISYRSNVATGTKVAYPVEFDLSGKPMAGSTSGGQYTGNWTICTLPTSNKSISDLISVGYNKDWSDGVYKNFEIISETYTTTTGKYTICDSSIIGGNGTSNPVIGYGIATGSIEMAQKK